MGKVMIEKYNKEEIEELGKLNTNSKAKINYDEMTLTVYKETGEVLKVFKLLREMWIIYHAGEKYTKINNISVHNPGEYTYN